jgi:hypothetical protein
MSHFFYQFDKNDWALGTHSRIQYLESGIDLRQFCIDQNFDCFDFTKSFSCSLETLMIDRLEALRHENPYLRLWFSGGKDSRVILDLSQKIGVVFDEIVIIDQYPAGRFAVGSQREIAELAIQYLSHCALPHTKISIIDLRPAHYNSVFSDPDWIMQSHFYNLHAPMHPPFFFRYVNPEFALLEKKTGMKELCGSAHPLIRKDPDGNIGFFFVDGQFVMESCDYDVENFLVSGDMPELSQAYARDLLQTYYDRGETVPDLITNTRHQRDRVPIYGRIRLPRQHAMLPKFYDGTWHPDDHELWRTNQSLKQWLHCLACEASGEHNEAWRNYRDLTDWDKIRLSNQHPGIVTKTYCL